MILRKKKQPSNAEIKIKMLTFLNLKILFFSNSEQKVR